MMQQAQSFADISFRVESHPKWETHLILLPSVEQARNLAAHLREVLNDGREVRTALGFPSESQVGPGEWTLFWKLHPSETRALLAHPAAEEWVATLALERGALERAVDHLETGATSAELRLDALARLGRPTNLHLTIRIS